MAELRLSDAVLMKQRYPAMAGLFEVAAFHAYTRPRAHLPCAATPEGSPQESTRSARTQVGAVQFALLNVHVSYGSSIHTRRQQVAELLRLLTTAAAGAGGAVGVSPQGRLWHDKQARRRRSRRLFPGVAPWQVATPRGQATYAAEWPRSWLARGAGAWRLSRPES